LLQNLTFGYGYSILIAKEVTLIGQYFQLNYLLENRKIYSFTIFIFIIRIALSAMDYWIKIISIKLVKKVE